MSARAPAFWFVLEGPKTKNGFAVNLISDGMTIEGWALARDGIASIDVSIDGAPIGRAHYGVVRPDVGLALRDWDNAERSGYTFHCPSRALPDGERLIEISARSNTGETHIHRFRATVKNAGDAEAIVSIRRGIRRVERDTLFGVLDQFNWRPEFRLVVTGDILIDPAASAVTLVSIVEQSWPHWRVTILASSEAEAIAMRATVERVAQDWSERIAVITPSASEQWNAPLANATAADLIMVLAAGDELGRDALGAFAIASGLHRSADCFYADEFRRELQVPSATLMPTAFFKPDYSPALLMSTNYIGRPLVVRPAVLAATGTTAASLMRDGFYDLVLRCTEAASTVHHLRQLLSRTDGGLFANREGSEGAPRRALARRTIQATLLPGLVQGTWRARRSAPVSGKVSIIIPTCAARGKVETCLKTLRGTTTNQNFEIICVDNIPAATASWKEFVREYADQVIDMPGAFNWSRFNNHAASFATGEYLLFLNDDTEIIEADWLDAMLEEADQSGVGVVGARLLFPNRTVQHAGIFLGASGIGRHAFYGSDASDAGYFGLALTRREVIAVTGACFMVRRTTFDQLGGFDEAHEVINNDLDFCLRSHQAGFRTIYTPYATLIHHERVSREYMKDDFDESRFSDAWHVQFAAGDPYFNPHLSRHSDHYHVDEEGVRPLFSGHPLLHRDEVKRVLVVKLDHIGDFITSLPAIRRLKALFPAARLAVLAMPDSSAFAAMEPAIDEFIPFEFFYPQSRHGERKLTQDDLDTLTERLAPYRFDVAVDLRKDLSTRHILRSSGAKLLAGYDSFDRFPWLDVALEWEGNKALQLKRNHIADDLLHLVAALETACGADRKVIGTRPMRMPVDELPAHARHLFDRPVVAIHPGAGNTIKRWPEGHFASLADLLIVSNDVSVLLIGGDDDVEIAKAIIDQVAHQDRLASVVAEVTLADLPRLLAACALFVGNDSGPKHIAAAMGVPTIGIHSGAVDPGEWAPMGERAVALHRNMSCSPCYLSKIEDCPRGLACMHLLEPALVQQMAETFLARPISSATPRLGTEPVRRHARRPGAESVTSPHAQSAENDVPKESANPRSISLPPLALSLDQLMMKFESLGDNCEFGLVQRSGGADPIGLLRFAGLQTPIEDRLGQLVSALHEGFKGLGAPGTVKLHTAGDNREFIVTETVYRLTYHTNLHEGQIEADELLRQELKRLPFLARKLLDDLQSARKIWVWRSHVTSEPAQLEPLVECLGHYGPNTLLWIVESDPAHPPGTVEWLNERLMKGYVEKFAPMENATDIRPRSWFMVCKRAYELHRSTAHERMKDTDGTQQQPQSIYAEPRSEERIGRNDPCPCGSGRKYKRCCGILSARA